MVKERSGPESQEQERATLRGMFNQSFAHWEIEIPAGAEPCDRAGRIVERGWAIWFRFGADDAGEFLDYYASHRMTDDRHVRLRPSGAHESLPALCTMRLASQNPAEDARLHAESIEANRRTEELLRQKGFSLSGAEPILIQLNRYLATNDEG